MGCVSLFVRRGKVRGFVHVGLGVDSVGEGMEFTAKGDEFVACRTDALGEGEERGYVFGHGEFKGRKIRDLSEDTGCEHEASVVVIDKEDVGV